MNTKKLTESIDHLSNRYIEEAMDAPVPTSQEPKTNLLSRVHSLSRQQIAAVAMVCIGIGIGYTVQYVLPDDTSIYVAEKPTTTPKNKNGIFSSLTVTAYAAERSDSSPEEGVSLEENVPTILSQYSPLMSSVPAMPFSFSFQDETASEDIHFTVSANTGGILQKYQQSDGIWEITEEDYCLTCEPDEKIYWQPLIDSPSSNKINQDEQIDVEQDDSQVKQEDKQPNLYDNEWIDSDILGADSFIEVQVYSGETLLETQYIGISHQDNYYTATLKLSVSMDLWENDDVTIISKGYDTTDEEVHQKILEERSGTSTNTQSGGQAGSPSDETEDEWIHAE
ncbi:MAG: hypothetical protein K2J67_11250 [Lachnospiraceae bacterium]|nr:hypothetical protein [Lachnospiraceae bacterium]